ILRVRDIRLLVGAVGLSAFGDLMLWTVLGLHIGRHFHSAFAVSAFFICLWSPVVALGGVAGVIVDGHENRRLLIAVSLVQAAGGARLGLLIDAATFVAVAVAGVMLHARRDPRAPEAASQTKPRARDGAAFLLGDRVLAVSLTAAIGSLVFFSMSMAAEIFFA